MITNSINIFERNKKNDRRISFFCYFQGSCYAFSRKVLAGGMRRCVKGKLEMLRMAELSSFRLMSTDRSKEKLLAQTNQFIENIFL